MHSRTNSVAPPVFLLKILRDVLRQGRRDRQAVIAAEHHRQSLKIHVPHRLVNANCNALEKPPRSGFRFL